MQAPSRGVDNHYCSRPEAAEMMEDYRQTAQLHPLDVQTCMNQLQ